MTTIQKNNEGGSANGRPLVSKTKNVSSTLAPPALNLKDKKNEKKRIIDLANKWFQLLNLYQWKIMFSFKEKKESIDAVYKPGELKMVDDIWEIAMTTQVDPYYLQAKITVWLPVIADMDDDELEETFLHECIHIMVSPISRPNKSKEEELVATNIARGIKNTYDIISSKKYGSRNIDPRRSNRKGNLTDSVLIGE